MKSIIVFLGKDQVPFQCQQIEVEEKAVNKMLVRVFRLRVIRVETVYVQVACELGDISEHGNPQGI